MTNKEAINILKRGHPDEIIYAVSEYEDYQDCVALYDEAIEVAIKALEAQGWIPVKTRELTAEEVKEVNEKYDVDLDGDEAWCICSPLPADNQEVLITTKYGDVVLTEFCVDVDGCYFDGYEERGDVLAWMPLPEPYTKEDDT